MNKKVINIITKTDFKSRIGGPNKVFFNTVKGFEKIGQPYVVNKNIDDYERNWIHSSIKGFIEAVNSGKPCVIGPNIFTLPRDIPFFTPKRINSVYLHPSNWCVDLWKLLEYNKSPLYSWPVGIDTDEFYEMTNRQTDHVMIYFKRRDPQLLEYAEKLIRSMGLTPLIIKYGNYTENEYIKTLNLATFGIWIGCSESQGIGLQEALSTNMPLIVLDCTSLFDSSQTNYIFPASVKSIKPTSVPYFDERCGIVISNISELEGAIKEMTKDIKNYSPRKYILENLTLEKMAEQLISFFDKLDFKYINRNKSISSDLEFKMSIKNSVIYFLYLINRKIKTAHKLLISK